MLATIGVNISPFIDLKIGSAHNSTLLALEEFGSFCILRLVQSLRETSALE
jgi:hypothetical protein